MWFYYVYSMCKKLFITVGAKPIIDSSWNQGNSSFECKKDVSVLFNCCCKVQNLLYIVDFCLLFSKNIFIWKNICIGFEACIKATTKFCIKCCSRHCIHMPINELKYRITVIIFDWIIGQFEMKFTFTWRLISWNVELLWLFSDRINSQMWNEIHKRPIHVVGLFL